MTIALLLTALAAAIALAAAVRAARSLSRRRRSQVARALGLHGLACFAFAIFAQLPPGEPEVTALALSGWVGLWGFFAGMTGLALASNPDKRRPHRPPDDSEDDGGGGPGRGPDGPPEPSWWPDFERDLNDYLRDRDGPDAPREPRVGAPT
jgi:hypothetical protein